MNANALKLCGLGWDDDGRRSAADVEEAVEGFADDGDVGFGDTEGGC